MILEICIDSFASALAAKQGGADRLEVCSALAVGGTTPSAALVDRCVNELGMPSMMMIRPHDGGFVYDEHELATMLASIKLARSTGVQGVVLGALTPERTLDVEASKRLLDAAGDLEVTFHRAIDVAIDPLGSLACLESLGFKRVLTSGQKLTASKGAGMIRQMVKQSTSISVIAASGINAISVAKLIGETNVTEVHASASTPSDSQSKGEVCFGESHRVTCPEKTRQIKLTLEGLS